MEKRMIISPPYQGGDTGEVINNPTSVLPLVRGGGRK